MSSEAWEKAVEAGARAASPHAFNDAFWLSRKAPDHHQRHARENARNHAEAVLRAAFPILAEELVKLIEGEAYGPSHDREGRLLYRTWAHWPTLPDGSKGNRGVDSFLVKHCDALAAELRARIQQMAEAL